MTEISSWRPLRERTAGVTDPRALVQGVPDFLLPALSSWLKIAITKSSGMLTSLQLRLQRTDVIESMEDNEGWMVSLDGEDLLEAIDAALMINSGLLDAHDYRLENAKKAWMQHVVLLRLRLYEAGSAWKINDDCTGLTERVQETVAQAARSTMADAPDDARQHLKAAWDNAYGYKPNPTLAYSEAVKAVEAVAIPATIPQNGRATLGLVIKHMRETFEKWSVVIDGPNAQPAPAMAALGLMELLWQGQRDRHAGTATVKPTTQEAAQAAVHAAVMLVQWFTSGAIRKSE